MARWTDLPTLHGPAQARACFQDTAQQRGNCRQSAALLHVTPPCIKTSSLDVVMTNEELRAAHKDLLITDSGVRQVCALVQPCRSRQQV